MQILESGLFVLSSRILRCQVSHLVQIKQVKKASKNTCCHSVSVTVVSSDLMLPGPSKSEVGPSLV